MAGVFLFAHPEQAVSMGYCPRPLSLKIYFTRFLPVIMYRSRWKMMIHCAMREVITLVFVHDILVIYIQALRISESDFLFCFFGAFCCTLCGVF